jgi:hypothetical protein
MEPSSELRDLIAGWFKAVEQGDQSWVDRHVSRQDGMRLIGTDPNEWLDAEGAIAFLKGEAEAMAGMVRASPGEPEAFYEGTVGWGTTRPTLTLPDGRTVSPRWSAVFHREDGEWKMVHLHASVGVANEELFGMDLPQ